MLDLLPALVVLRAELRRLLEVVAGEARVDVAACDVAGGCAVGVRASGTVALLASDRAQIRRLLRIHEAGLIASGSSLAGGLERHA